MREKCPFAYRIRGDYALHCRAIQGKHDYCAHQYFCRVTHRSEATDQTDKCPLRKQKLKK